MNGNAVAKSILSILYFHQDKFYLVTNCLKKKIIIMSKLCNNFNTQHYKHLGLDINENKKIFILI